jgi:hypothetical protein
MLQLSCSTSEFDYLSATPGTCRQASLVRLMPHSRRLLSTTSNRLEFAKAYEA